MGSIFYKKLKKWVFDPLFPNVIFYFFGLGYCDVTIIPRLLCLQMLRYATYCFYIPCFKTKGPAIWYIWYNLFGPHRLSVSLDIFGDVAWLVCDQIWRNFFIWATFYCWWRNVMRKSSPRKCFAGDLVFFKKAQNLSFYWLRIFGWSNILAFNFKL